LWLDLFFEDKIIEKNKGLWRSPLKIAFITTVKKLPEFQSFLAENGINYRLMAVQEGGRNAINVLFKNGSLHFYDVASTGAVMLALIFYWSMDFSDKLQFLFIDGFDAYYHFESARLVFEYLAQKGTFQSILTTHDTYLMQNEITRPDCVFLVCDNETVRSLNKCTGRELREAHNIEKIYRNGGFEE